MFGIILHSHANIIYNNNKNFHCAKFQKCITQKWMFYTHKCPGTEHFFADFWTSEMCLTNIFFLSQHLYFSEVPAIRRSFGLWQNIQHFFVQKLWLCQKGRNWSSFEHWLAHPRPPYCSSTYLRHSVTLQDAAVLAGRDDNIHYNRSRMSLFLSPGR